MKRLAKLTTIRPVRYSMTYVVSTRSISNDKGPETFYETIDRWFSSPPPEVQSEPSSWLFAFHELTGMEGWCVLLCAGVLTRLATLYFSLYGERAAIRMQVLALPELKPAYDAFQRVYNSDRYKATDVQVERIKLQSFKKDVYKKHQTSNLKTMTGLLGAPLVMMGFRAASNACDPTYLGTSSALHFVCSVPDPLFILPVVTCGMTLLNFEMTLNNREDLKQGWINNICWIARTTALIGVPVTSGLSSGVLLYWLGMSAVGILQPLLFRYHKFLKLFNVPRIPLVRPKHPRTDVNIDNLQMRLGIQHPFLNKIMNPDTDESLNMVLNSSREHASPDRSSEVRQSNYHSLGHLRTSSSKSESTEERPINSLADMACVEEDTISGASSKSVSGLRVRSAARTAKDDDPNQRL